MGGSADISDQMRMRRPRQICLKYRRCSKLNFNDSTVVSDSLFGRLLHYTSFNISTKRSIALSVFLGVEMVVRVPYT